jgi:hypothetical protein
VHTQTSGIGDSPQARPKRAAPALHDAQLLFRWGTCPHCSEKTFRAVTFHGAVLDVCTSCDTRWPARDGVLERPYLALYRSDPHTTAPRRLPRAFAERVALRGR